MNNKEFDNILDDCLERLLVKGESLEQCLEHYPAQADELRPLLETALAAREASAIQPRPDFRARARYQFHSALKEMAAGKSRSSWGWFPRWATVVAVVLVLVLAGGGTVFAAESSMPDSTLYSVKLTTEQVRLALTPSQMGKAKLCAELADRRVVEIAYMADRGDAQQVELITQRLDDKLDLLVVLIGGEKAAEPEMLMVPAPATPPPPTTTAPTTGEAPPPGEETEVPPPPPAEDTVPPATAVPQEGRGWDDDSAHDGTRAQLRDTLVTDAVSNRAVLNEALDKAPERARDALRRALEVSDEGYEQALEALK
jgi:hypothetical protein